MFSGLCSHSNSSSTRTPVPAGINPPMITFYFKPTKLSTLDWIAA